MKLNSNKLFNCNDNYTGNCNNSYHGASVVRTCSCTRTCFARSGESLCFGLSVEVQPLRVVSKHLKSFSDI